MLVYGRNVALGLLESGKEIKRVILQDNFDDKKILSLIEKSEINVEYKMKRDIDRLADKSHQGIILDIADYKYHNLDDLPLEKDDCFLIITDHLEDPHNLGAIIRTSEAAGVDGIVIPKNRSVSVTPTVMKTSAGALENIPLAMVTNLHQTIKKLKDKGFFIIGTDMDGTDYTEIDYSSKIALVVGNEGNGIARLVRESCDIMATIPMRGKVNSLNASVATAIMIYQVINSRK